MNLLQQSITKLAILTIAMSSTGCAKEVYIYSNDYGESKFTIYKDNYKYQEKTRDSNFYCWGKYEVSDSTIVFILKEERNIPFPYLLNNAEQLSGNLSADFAEVHVVDFETRAPIPFASIALKDSLNNIITGTETDFDGRAKIKKTENIEFIEVSYVGYATHRIGYEGYKNHDILIKIESLKRGGRLSEACVATFVDYLLEYEINDPDQIEALERYGVKYEKVKTP